MNILNALKGISGEFEIGRVLLASGGAAAIITPIAFQAADMIWHSARFDVTAWCLAYPGGLAAISGFGVFSIGNKDKAVAAARQTQAQPPLDDKGGA